MLKYKTIYFINKKNFSKISFYNIFNLYLLYFISKLSFYKYLFFKNSKHFQNFIKNYLYYISYYIILYKSQINIILFLQLIKII